MLPWIDGLGLVILGMMFFDTLFHIFAAISLGPPGIGAVGSSANYSGLEGASQLIPTALMALGRLESFAVLVLFMPSLWRKY